MRRINPWMFIAAIVAVFVSTASAAGDLPAKPNIVIILADDLGYGDISCYNNASLVQTRHVDALAGRGMRFTNAHTPSGVCSPTRYGLLTGRHPFRDNLAKRVQFNYNDVWIDEDRRTLADVLRANGYATGMSGKWHLGYNVFDSEGEIVTGKPGDQAIRPDWSKGIADGPFDRGFDRAFGIVSSADIPPYKFYSDNRWVSDETVWTEGAKEFDLDLFRPGWIDAGVHPNTITRRIRDEAVAFIAERAGDDKPFFLYVPLPAPHTPTAPHPDYLGKTPHRYTDYVKEVDEVVGTLVAKLKEKDELANTLIVFTSDNGASLRWANAPGHTPNGPLRGQKADTWEGGHRVPFVVAWGDGTPVGSRIRPGVVTDETINLLDMMRTIATLTGSPLEEGEAVDSYNVLPALLGDGTDLRIREAQFSTSMSGCFAIAQKDEQGNDWKLIFSAGSGNGFSNPKGGVVNPLEPISDYSQLQLYNLASDLGEKNNLLADGGDEAARAKADALRVLLARYIESGRSAPMP